MNNMNKNTIRKVPLDLESPLEKKFILLAEFLNPYFKKYNFTPNGITTLSTIFIVLTLYFFYYDYYLLAAVCIVIEYIFDCCDGSYARKYNMTSKFGDIYDHVTDMSLIVGIFIIILVKPLKIHIKIMSLLVFCISLWLLTIHMGCSEEYMNAKKRRPKNDSILNSITFCIGDYNDVLKWSKYFSPITGILVCVCIFIIFHFIEIY
tara:strand:+ start:779 stop:1396 length:618 start_codon:yes stop_codon:yes gene_type:complete